MRKVALLAALVLTDVIAEVLPLILVAVMVTTTSLFSSMLLMVKFL